MRLTRLRAAGVALVAVVAAGTLSACHTNVGTAAVIDGRTVSESEVSSYLTPNARSVPVSSTSKVPPRVFVLDVLILEPYFRKLVETTSVGHLSARKLAAIHSRELAGKTDASVAAQSGVIGYTSSFNKVFVDLSILAEARTQLAQAGKLKVTKVPFTVHLNPRYGTWSNGKSLLIDSSSSAGLPNFLTLQPASGA